MPEEQPPVEGQDPVPAAPQPVAATGPWAQDLEAFDPAVRSQLDEYMRTKVQPRMTQLEQSAAEARDAQRLLSDLQTNPADTMAALAAELQWAPEAYEAPPEAIQAVNDQIQPMDPRLESLLAKEAQREAEAAYDSEMNRIVAQHPGLDPEDMHPFVVSAEGDFDQAVLLRNAYVERWNVANTPPSEPAPPTLAGDVGSTTPPVAEPMLDIAGTVKQFLASIEPGDAPPVS